MPSNKHDRGQYVAFFALMQMYGAALIIDVAFENEEDREAELGLRKTSGSIGKRRRKLITAGSREPSDPHPIPIRLSSRTVLNQVS